MTSPRREVEIKAILDAVDDALHAENIPDRQRTRIMNRLLVGEPDGINTRRATPPLRVVVPPELLHHDYASSLAVLLAAQVEARGLRPDGTIPNSVESADIAWTDITDPASPHPDGRVIEINWAPQ